MKISKPTQYVIIVGGILALAGIAWNIYNNFQENNSEAISSPSPVTQASANPGTVAKASAVPAAKAPTNPKTTASLPQNAQTFREAVNHATSAADLTQTAKTKAEWNAVSNDWQRAIDLMKAVPSTSPNYQVAQKKIVEYQRNLNFANKASQLAK